jgi:hypothetical protein
MALLWIDGFDTYQNGTNIQANNYIVQNNSLSITTGQYGVGQSVVIARADGIQYLLPTPQATMTMGAAINTQNNSTIFMAFYDGDYFYPQIYLYSNFILNNILVYRGNGNRYSTDGILIGSTPVNTFFPNVFNYVELKATINSSTGSVAIQVNGVLVLSLTNVNTQNTANPYCDRVGFNVYSNVFQQFLVDNWYICDTSGSAPQNSFLGDVLITTLFPTGEGSVDDFTPNGLSPNYLNVNTSNPNSVVNYNSSLTSGNKDLFTIGTLPNSYTIFGASIMTHAVKSSAGTQSIANEISDGTTNYQLPSFTLNSIPLYDTNVMQSNPITSAPWTPTDFTTLQIGYAIP